MGDEPVGDGGCGMRKGQRRLAGEAARCGTRRALRHGPCAL